MTIMSAVQGRRRLTVQGTVQGVGFRPFVYRLATELGLAGGVKNTPQGVVIEVEGLESQLETFLHQLQQALPPYAAIQTLAQQSLPLQGLHSFQIWSSEATIGTGTVQILPDLATCSECLQEMLTTNHRRYGYPFTHCTHCGPRFSVITGLPYDRQHTTLAAFAMCSDCAAEYRDPTHRRFHAQPNACANCGPQLEFWTGTEQQRGDVLPFAIASLQRGEIVALKGLGGFQLLVDAQQPAVVARLRQRKNRPDKPLALMYPTLEQVRHDCLVSEAAAALLTSGAAPIVLLPKRGDARGWGDAIAPNNPDLGVMLPTTPLHYQLLHQYGSPLVATSGNRSGEPICRHEQDVQLQLSAIADSFWVHNRPIQRPVDDSVVHIVQGQAQILRHARGYAPQAIQLPVHLASDVNVLALGAHFKNTIALSLGEQALLSQHIGDLETPQTMERLQQTVTDLLALYRCQPTIIACDLHPDYRSTQFAQTLAQKWQIPLIFVQHHYAHVLSGMAEHQLTGPTLGIAWDGTGYGLDQTLWGGEFLQITDRGFERIAHWLPFPLPGGDICSREPRRSALGLLYSCYGEAAFQLTALVPIQTFSPSQLRILQQMLVGKVNTPMTSSMGRLFDGLAALLNLHQTISFEGQAAMALEFIATKTPVDLSYPFSLSTTLPYVIDWRPMVQAMVHQFLQGGSPALIAARFHRTLGDIIQAIVQRVGISQIVLTGGCFQNRLLSEQVIQNLNAAGFTPYWHQRVPPNDGGISVGQVLAALHHLTI